MEMDFYFQGMEDFDPETYLRILISIAKADKDNGPREYEFVRRKALKLGLDYENYMRTTDKTFTIGRRKLSRLTALVVLRDAIMLASMDRNFSLPEKQRIYTYAERLGIPRKDVDALEDWLADYRRLSARWELLVTGVAV